MFGLNKSRRLQHSSAPAESGETRGGGSGTKTNLRASERLVVDETRSAAPHANGCPRGHAVTRRGRERALAQSAGRATGVVVTDLRMSGMDGMALFQSIQAQNAALPVIILTAHGTIPDAVAAVKSGLFGYLTKPFEARTLLTEIERALSLGRGAGEAGNDGGDETWRKEDLRAPRGRGLSKHASSQTAMRVFHHGDRHRQGAQGARDHRREPARGQPFVAINCARFPSRFSSRSSSATSKDLPGGS